MYISYCLLFLHEEKFRSALRNIALLFSKSNYFSHYMKLHIQAQHFINATQISYIPKPFDVNRPIPHPQPHYLHTVAKYKILSNLGMRNSFLFSERFFCHYILHQCENIFSRRLMLKIFFWDFVTE